MTARVFHRSTAGAPMQPFFDWWEANGLFDLTVPQPSGGNRTKPMQRFEWSKGREVIPGHDPELEASWRIVHLPDVVTHAFSYEDSGHGHEGAADLLAVRSHFAGNGMPASVWLGTEKDPTERAEAIRLQTIITDAARAFGLECGADWPADRRDPDHYQVPHWKELPLHVAAPA